MLRKDARIAIIIQINLMYNFILFIQKVSFKTIFNSLLFNHNFDLKFKSLGKKETEK